MVPTIILHPNFIPCMHTTKIIPINQCPKHAKHQYPNTYINNPNFFYYIIYIIYIVHKYYAYLKIDS
jgi:hypothetical protein